MATVDVDVRSIDINQCDDGDGVYAGTHRCSNSTKVFASFVLFQGSGVTNFEKRQTGGQVPVMISVRRLSILPRTLDALYAQCTSENRPVVDNMVVTQNLPKDAHFYSI